MRVPPINKLQCYAYPGELIMLFGDRSEAFNPFFGKESPVLRWRNKHSNAIWGFIGGPYGEFAAQCE